VEIAEMMPWLIGIGIGIVVLIVLLFIKASFHFIPADMIGAVKKNFGIRKLKGDQIIALEGEVGWQASCLMPGWRFKFWPLYTVKLFPVVQVGQDEIGVVFSQIGENIPVGWRTARQIAGDTEEIYSDVGRFMREGGQKGIQRAVLSPGHIYYMHPIAFVVKTATSTFGMPFSESVEETFGQYEDQKYRPLEIKTQQGSDVDIIGLVTILDGPPNPDNTPASRIGGFSDIQDAETKRTEEAKKKYEADMEALGAKENIEREESKRQKLRTARDKFDKSKQTPEDRLEYDEEVRNIKQIPEAQREYEESIRKLGLDIINMLFFQSKVNLHNSYQDMQKFFDAGGCQGLQHDVITYGKYNFNPFLVRVEEARGLVVPQGKVAVVRAGVGLASEDVSGEGFKHGFIVRPGHRGIWNEALRPGKYLINPHIYATELVPTSIITLNWAKETSVAHKLDERLSQINARSKEGFQFSIDLQVQIHVPDTKAPYVIVMVEKIDYLVSEVLHPAVGNYFRDKLQGMQAIQFIQERQKVQEEATEHIKQKLEDFKVECYGVFIQDVIPPEDLVDVLKNAELAVQQKKTLEQQKITEDARLATEKSKGEADQQAALAKSKIDIEISRNAADAQKLRAEGEGGYKERIGEAEGKAIEARGKAEAEVIKQKGLSEAEALEKKNKALGGAEVVASIEIIKAIAANNIKITPDILINGGESGADKSTSIATALIAKILQGGAAPNSAIIPPTESKKS